MAGSFFCGFLFLTFSFLIKCVSGVLTVCTVPSNLPQRPPLIALHPQPTLSFTFSGIFWVMGVAMNPGRTELHRIPWLREEEWMLTLGRTLAPSLSRAPTV